jgi:predicted  nucleic acid-binding Zn-ribbon protein
MYYYAYLNNESRVLSVYVLPVAVLNENLVQITKELYEDERIIGAKYDRATGTFMFWACSTDNVQYKNTTESLSAKIDEMDSFLSAEGSNVAALVGEVADVRSIAENAGTGVDRLDTQLASLSNQVGGVEDAVAAANTRIDDNQRSIENLVTAVSGNAIDIQDIKAENIQQKARVNELDDALYAFKDETAKNIEHINKNFQQINANFDGVREDISGLTEKQDRTDNSINTIWADIRIKEAEMADYKAETAENFAEVQNAVNNLDSRASANAGDIASLIGSMNNAESNISAIAIRTTRVENRATTLESSVATNKTNITSVTSKANTNATNISNLTTRMTTAENNINTNKSDIADIKADYLPKTGGTVSGDLDVSGVLRMRGSQAFFYNVDAKTMNIGTNNATVVNMAGVHSGGTMNINSATLRPYNVIPRDNNSLLGNSNYRWKGIYSQAAVNVSSDERLKKDIAETDSKELAEFINKLPVKTYKYKDDEMNIDRIGLIAQDIIKADPKLSRYFVSSEGDGFYSLKSADLVFPLIAAVQQLSEKIEELKK